jgi:hypothetical protein
MIPAGSAEPARIIPKTQKTYEIQAQRTFILSYYSKSVGFVNPHTFPSKIERCAGKPPTFPLNTRTVFGEYLSLPKNPCFC